MVIMSWRDFYASDLQGLWGLLIAPALFLLRRTAMGRPRTDGALPAGRGFVDAYAIAVAFETMLDPIASGPLLRYFDLADHAAGTAVVLFFVLLGDLRVYLLVFALLALAHGRAWWTALPRAALWTLVVPVLAYTTNTLLRARVPELHHNSIWLVYELIFTLVAVGLCARVGAWVPASAGPALGAFLRGTLAYVAGYYALWAAADVLIQLLRLDIGWLLRVVPNQLYYSLWVPITYVRFFARSRPPLRAAQPAPATGAPLDRAERRRAARRDRNAVRRVTWPRCLGWLHVDRACGPSWR